MIKMRLLPAAVMSVIAITTISGCSVIDKNPIYGENGIIRDRNQEYETATVAKRLEIPPSLRAKPTNDLLVIPKVGVTSSALQDSFEVPRPEFFYADTGSDAVSLKRQGGDKIIVVDESIDIAWTKVLEFFKFNSIKVESADARQGVIETDWIKTDGPQYHAVDRWVKHLTFQDIPEGTQDKIRVTLRPGKDAPQRTAIVMQHAQFSKNEKVDAVDWQKESADVGYKTDMMFSLLRYMSKATDQSADQTLLSMQNQQNTRPLLGRDSSGNPVLKIDESVDKAWAMLNNAADSAGMDIGTRDQKQGLLYMTYITTTPVEQKRQGFFEWMFSDRGDIKLNTGSLGALVGADEDAAKDGIRYSSKSADELVQEFGDPEDLSNQDGYKIWLAGRVVYVFNSGASKGRINKDKGVYQSIGRYQVKLNRTRSGILVSVLDDQGLDADANVAEEILWDLKDAM